MTRKNLEQLLRESPSTVDMLRNSQIGAYVYPVVPTEFTQLARRAAGLARDGGAVRPVAPHGRTDDRGAGRASCSSSVWRSTACKSFPVNRAKHFVPVSPDGHVIGDVICFRLAEDRFVLVGRVPTVNWVEFNGTTGGYDVKIDPRRPLAVAARRQAGSSACTTASRSRGRTRRQILEKLNGGPIPDVKFFHIGRDHHRRPQGARRCATAWPARRASRSGGPTPRRTRKSARRSCEAAKEASSDLRQVGARAYATNTLESGWIPSPLPASTRRRDEGLSRVAAGRRLRGRRLDRRQLRLGRTSRTTTYALRARLRHLREVRPRLHRPRGAREDRRTSRTAGRSTFAWNADDVARVLPLRLQRDELSRTTSTSTCPTPTTPRRTTTGDEGRPDGRALDVHGYSFNERCMLSLGVVEPDMQVGDVLTLVWGEETAAAARPRSSRTGRPRSASRCRRPLFARRRRPTPRLAHAADRC